MGLRRLAFVLLLSVVCVFVSERMYWYFSRGIVEQIELVAFYAMAVAAVPWLLGRYRVSDGWGVMLVVPVFAYLVEGAIVPVLYSGGPFVPVFPGLFTFWHGMLGVWLVLLVFRRWLLTGRWRPLLSVSLCLGLYWGLWAQTAVVEAREPEWIETFGGPPPILSTTQFGLYAAVCTAALATAHWLLGFVWLPEFVPSRWSRRLWLVGVGSVVGLWSVVIPWAAPMFAVYAGLQLWALRRHRPGDGPTVLVALTGRVSALALWPLVAIPIAASVSHRFWSSLQLSETVIENWIFLLLSVIQVAIGMAALVASHWRRIRRSRQAVTKRGPQDPMPAAPGPAERGPDLSAIDARPSPRM